MTKTAMYIYKCNVFDIVMSMAQTIMYLTWTVMYMTIYGNVFEASWNVIKIYFA